MIHVGDINMDGNTCPKEWLLKVAEALSQINSPFIYTPGDNETTDCIAAGGKPSLFGRIKRKLFSIIFNQEDPGRRLVYQRAIGNLREIFFSKDGALGQRDLKVNRQSESDEYPEFRENVKFQVNDVVFGTIHTVGGGDNMKIMATEHLRRKAANLAWLKRIFAQSHQENVKALVLVTHVGLTDIDINKPKLAGAYRELQEAVYTATRNLRKPVLYIHGSGHDFLIESPVHYSGGMMEGLTRLQVDGYPRSGFVRVEVNTDKEYPFAFHEHIID